MADDLIVSGGGSTAVSTADLLGHGRRLGRLAKGLGECELRLAAIDRGITGLQLQVADAPFSAFAAERSLDDASLHLRWAQSCAQTLEASLAVAAEAYGGVERQLQSLAQTLSAKVAAGLGSLFPGLALLLTPGVVSAAVIGAAGYALASDEQRAALALGLQENNELLTNPEVVQLVRLGVMSADDFLGGLLRVNPELVRMIGDEGLGLLGLTGVAGLTVGMASGLGALAETPVTVTRVSTRTDKAPAASFEERVRRIPESTAQVRIDRYRSPGEPDRFEVYLGGTKDLGLVANREPWDMTSNVNALSMGDPGSYRAAAEAMRLAGVDADSPVVFSGHSQGGLIAAALAASGDYNAQGLFTVGGPISQNLVPDGVPWVAIEHTDDLVPALGGNRTGTDAVLVRREAFGGETVPGNVLFPAHDLGKYQQTAAMLDLSDDGRSGKVLGHLNRLGTPQGEGVARVEVTSTRYLAKRIPS